MEIVLENPLMLLFLLMIPLLIVLHFYFFQHTKKRAMKFSNFAALKRVTGTTLITKNTNQLVLRSIILVVLILAAAQPVFWYEGQASITDYVIAIDASASMLSEDVQPDRFTVAKRSAASFIDSLNVNTKVGLISFAGVTFIKKPLTDDLDSVKNSIDELEIELSGGTDIGSALITAANILMIKDSSKVVILITDGSNTAGSFIDESLETGLAYIRDSHVIVHAIGIGTGQSQIGYIEDSKLLAIYNKQTIEKIAEQTGGKSYQVQSSAEIAAAFRDIEQNSKESMLSFETSYIFLGLAVILLLLEWGLLNTKFRALP